MPQSNPDMATGNYCRSIAIAVELLDLATGPGYVIFSTVELGFPTLALWKGIVFCELHCMARLGEAELTSSRWR